MADQERDNDDELDEIFGPPNPHPQKVDEEWISIFEKGMDTQGRVKLQRYFDEIVKTRTFIEKIRDWRKRYNIPSEGFTTERHILPPEEWQLRHTDLDHKLDDEIRDWCRENGLHFIHWTDTIQLILFYNDYSVIAGGDGPDLCMFSDLRNEAEEPFMKEVQDADNLLFPLAIRISPYASQRDILNYVKQNAGIIKKWQEKYKEGLGGDGIGRVKKRKETVRERNDFIYQNRHLPHREIMRLVIEKFGDSPNTPDQGHIGKIISLEKGRRKEV